MTRIYTCSQIEILRYHFMLSYLFQLDLIDLFFRLIDFRFFTPISSLFFLPYRISFSFFFEFLSVETFCWLCAQNFDQNDNQLKYIKLFKNKTKMHKNKILARIQDKIRV